MGKSTRFSGCSISAIQLHQQFPSSGGVCRIGLGKGAQALALRRARLWPAGQDDGWAGWDRKQRRADSAAAPGTTPLLFMEAKAGRAAPQREGGLSTARGAAH